MMGGGRDFLDFLWWCGCTVLNTLKGCKIDSLSHKPHDVQRREGK